ncbi:ATP-binding protein [Streptomyces sp. NPDC091281]|uniref:ATP-binding protein n=1 Tax=Streptomyces sp. NPDC091281 TaxID=3365985 RepID=UPI003823F1FF
MISNPSRHCAVELQALPSRIGQIRRIVSAQLRYWHLDPLIDRAALGVTELLTNVHLHARPDKTCVVELELLLDRLTVSVRDRDPRLPVVDDIDGVAFDGLDGADLCGSPAHPAHLADNGSVDSLATCGRGLAMVAAVSESWGARPDGDTGKVVWFTLPASVPVPERAARPPRRLAVDDLFPAVAVPVAVDDLRPVHAPARSAVVG